MQRMINHALSGDQEALDLPEVHDGEVIPAVKTITRQSLQAQYKYACEQYIAALHLQIRGMERLAKQYLLHLSWINKHHFDGTALTNKVTHIHAEDILEEMSQMSKDLPLTRPRRYVSDSEDTDEDDEPMQSGKDHSQPEPEVEERMNRPSSSSSRKRKLTPSTSEPRSSTPKSPKSSKRSHHKRRHCQVPGCDFHGLDLKRHMQVHVRKGEISQDNVTRLSSIMSKGSKQRGKTLQKNKGGKPKRGRFRKWCPVPGCDKILVNVGRHLSSSKHRMK